MSTVTMQADKDTDRETREIILQGRVQGVGFRPFIYRLARQHGLDGYVRNCVGEVFILVRGKPPVIDSFVDDIFRHRPPLANPVLKHSRSTEPVALSGFHIEHSAADGIANISVPADIALCDDCLREINDPADRRYRYPFINCTQCGPRYTLIKQLPYDRPNTTMQGFPLCDRCRHEYEDPADRRFHAEPVACAQCGPRLVFSQAATDVTLVEGNEPALQAALDALRKGAVIAVKGIGGYHLMCDATDDAAVARLRERKPRPHKPLAVMLPVGQDGGDSLHEYVTIDADDRHFLALPASPLLLVPRAAASRLSEGIAPGLDEVGVMFPYSPLHHLLLAGFGRPLVATSANISGDPVLTDNAMVETRLGAIADGFLHHDRPIERPADDPVYRTIAGKPRPLRTGRGVAPLEVVLPFELEQPVLAVGAHMKNTVALAWQDRAVISPHIGEMGKLRSQQVFEQTIEDLQRLYSVRAQVLLCDAHPGYASTRWAMRQQLPVHRVWHHHAHASAAVYRCWFAADSMVFTWDGVGLGEDGSLWGGEALLGRPGRWRRMATMRPFRLPGGERAGRESWRSAAALCWHSSREWTPPHDVEVDISLLNQAWQRGINSPQTSAVGRLFDAAASLVGVRHVYSFEGQGAMELEALAHTYQVSAAVDDSSSASAGNPPLSSCHHHPAGDGIITSDWENLLDMLSDEHSSRQLRAWRFHQAMARLLLEQALQIRDASGVCRVALCGGVFQNRVLTELAISQLERHGFDVFLPDMIPVNDAAISFGQIIDYGHRSADAYPGNS